ncbi:MAG: SLBB domain-containing protein [Tenericutes bacterium]|nr:SLBB domain-containing protein [Mycoplasmatota bacterium]
MEYLKNNKGVLILVIGFFAFLIYNFSGISETNQVVANEYSETLITTLTSVEVESYDYIMVDIKGEVNYPGLYQVVDGMRLGDLINIAGGATLNANLSNMNQAMILVDEMNITIPAIEEVYEIPDDIIKIKVEIKGCVMNPGVYVLYANARVTDLIVAAGGFTAAADLDSVFQAKILTDGETILVAELVGSESEETTDNYIEEREIYVEITGEVINPGIYLIPESYSVQDLIYEAGGVTVNCDLEKINWNLTLCLGATLYIPSYEDESVDEEVYSDKVNINTADLEELITLTGIGQILGQRIIDYRAECGSFLSIEEIMYVSGIKTSIYEEIKESITV